MEPLFSIEYSEYCVADTLSKLLYTPKQFNVSVFVPTSRQEKGIDLMLYRHEDATCHNFTATIQVKSSRVYSLSEEEIQKSNNCSFALWYPKFSPSPRADFFVLTAQYPHFPKTPYLTQGKRGSSSASVHWKNLFILFTHAEMVEFLNHAKPKRICQSLISVFCSIVQQKFIQGAVFITAPMNYLFMIYPNIL